MSLVEGKIGGYVVVLLSRGPPHKVWDEIPSNKARYASNQKPSILQLWCMHGASASPPFYLQTWHSSARATRIIL